MHRFFEALGRFAVRFRWFILVFWIVALIVTNAVFPKLGSVVKSNNTDFLPKNSPSLKAANLAAPFQSSNETPVPVIAVRPNGTLTPADRQALINIEQRLSKVDKVTDVKDAGPSQDGQANELVVLATFSGGSDQAAKTLVKDMRAAIAADANNGLQVHLAGELATQVDIAANQASSSTIDLVSIIMIFLLLLAIFRSLLAPLLTLGPAIIANAIAAPVIAELTKAGLDVSFLTQILLIVLMLGAGTDYGLFLVFRVREEMNNGLSHRDAVAKSVAKVGESVVFSAGTVIAALLSLLLATFGIYRSLGLPLAIGIFIMLLVGLTLTPALVAIFGRAAFWPTKPHKQSPKTGAWGRIASGVIAKPALTLTVGLVVFGALAFASTNNQPIGFTNGNNAPAGSDSAAGNAALAQHFPESAANPTNPLFKLAESAWNNPSVLVRLENSLKASGQFATMTGPLNPNGVPLTPERLVQLHNQLGPPNLLPPVEAPGTNVAPLEYAAFRATSNYIAPDNVTIQYLTSLTAGDPSTTKAINAVPDIRKAVENAAHEAGAADWALGGEAPAAHDISKTSNDDLKRVVPVAIIVIGILLAIVLRSLVAPVYLIASVALSYLAALGVAVILFVDIGGETGLTFILPFLMFIFLLALGEDYNILVMTRIREEAHHLPLRQAVQKAVALTGTTVTSAGLVLAGTFTVFAVVGGGGQVRDIGAGLAIGILMDTFLVRTLLVPSTVVLLGRWNWWPSHIDVDDPEPEVDADPLVRT